MTHRASLTSPGANQIDVRTMSIQGYGITVAIRQTGTAPRPLLFLNGISANWELARPFMEALTDRTVIIFDAPGVGGSSTPILPYRISTVACLAVRVLAELGYHEADVAGVSWGGAVAQEIAYQYPKWCRKLVLGATSPGAIMFPGNPAAILKMATQTPYWDKTYLQKATSSLKAVTASHAMMIGCVYQLLAIASWTSLPWLRVLQQPTLILMGRDDPLVSTENGELLRILIRNAQLEILDDGHLFFITSAEETACKVEQFLRGAVTGS